MPQEMGLTPPYIISVSQTTPQEPQAFQTQKQQRLPQSLSWDSERPGGVGKRVQNTHEALFNEAS